MTGLSTKQFVKEMMVIMPVLLRNMHKIQSDAVMRGHITVPQFLALDMIMRRGSLKMSSIARELKVSTPAATGIVERMHALGMVARRYDRLDRRVILIAITPKGKKVVQTLHKERGRMIGKLFGCLTAAERASYLKILTKVHNVASKKDRS